jgi:nitrogen regulatory protein P-II 1
MKKLEAIVRSERMPSIGEKLKQVGIGSTTISTVSGCCKQRQLHLRCRGQSIAHDLLPKLKFDMVISYDQVEKGDDMANSSRKGEHGDGVTLVSSVEQHFNIATLEKGEKVVI